MTRRLLLVFLVLFQTSGAGAQDVLFPDGLAAGDVRQDAAIIWTRSPRPAEVRVEYAMNPGFIGAQVAGPAHPTAEADFTVKIELRGLQPGQRYHYRAVAGIAAGQAGAVGQAGTFVTAPSPDASAPLSLVWGADTYENYKPFRIFQAMQGRNADIFFYLGDTIYSDLGARALTLDQYRQKYRNNREDAHLRAFLPTTSSWVVWDDHEVENNFGAGHGRLATGLRAFMEYWPIHAPAEQPTRLYRSLRWGRTAEIFILDTRQYRSPSRMPDGAEKTMLGAAQKQWLLDGLARSDATVKIVASSVALRYHGSDSWAGYARERDEILRFIRDRGIHNVIFLVADVHYAALIRHPEGPYEAIAGPLAAFAAETPRARGRPGTVWAAAGKSNYGWLRIPGDGILIGWWDDHDAPMYEARLPFAR